MRGSRAYALAGVVAIVGLAAGCSQATTGEPGAAARPSGVATSSGSTIGGSVTGTPSSSPTTVGSTKPLVRWPDNATIPHLFYHSLIVDPARAFHAPQGKGPGYADYMVTLTEFKAQLAQMYARGYVLVHPERIAAKNADGVMTYQPIMLPAGKKPMVLSIDDVSYYEYMTGDGFATNLTIGADGRVTNTYTDAEGVTKQGSYDVSTVVDDFVRDHPDFSYHGDKGSIGLTGYNGVLGYRTSVRKYGDTPATRAAQEQAKKVADAMKKDGWNFASHSWGHLNFTKTGVSGITADANRWDAEVRPIVGDTPELIFPFGADISGIEPYSNSNAKFRFLHGTEKFDYFFPVDASTTHWMQLTPGALRQARINVDGISLSRALSGHKTPLSAFFDPRSTVDPLRPKR